MFTAALGVGALQAQDTKSVEGIWFAETTVANNVVRQENNLKEDFKVLSLKNQLSTKLSKL